MARTARVKSETRTYHVMLRGKAGQAIFLDEEDYRRFLDLLEAKGAGQDFLLYAYCLMGNHVHLLLREEATELSQIMNRINVAYAYYFNHKYGRTGPLFQDRFKSEAIEDDTHFLTVIRHIHRIPEKAGMVDKAEQYPWSSYAYYLKRNAVFPVPTERDYVVRRFWPEIHRAIQLFERFSRQPDDREYLSMPDDIKTERSITSVAEAKEYATVRCREKGSDLDSLKDGNYIELRNEIIVKLKQESALSVRKIAGLLGVGRNIVQRVR